MFSYNRYIRFSLQIINLLITLPAKWLGYLVPVKKDIWVFGHTFGYKDNPKYVYEYLVDHPEYEIRPIWITKDRHLISALGESYYYLSLKGLYFQYRAAVALVATGMNDVASFTLANKKIVQLWHGIPIKKLLLDSPEMTPFPASWKNVNRIFYSLLKRKLSRYTFVAAVNVHNQSCFSQAFGLPKEKVKITGMPRHDIILEAASKNLNTKQQKILYAPTWHPSLEDAEMMVSNVLSEELITHCQSQSIKIDVSIHPLNNMLINSIENNEVVTVVKSMDINEELYKYDMLITDYSSIALDFSILDRPVIFVCDNITKYAEERGIYEYFTSILMSRNVQANNLVDEIIKIEQNTYKSNNIYDLLPVSNARIKTIEEVLKIL